MKKIYKIRLTVALIVLCMTTFAIIGLYPIHFLNLQLGALIQRTIHDYSSFAIYILGGIILFTLLFGRFYCSTLCPFGIMQEAAIIIYNKFKGEKLPDTEYAENKPYKYYIAALTLGALIGGSALLIRYIDPYTVFGSWISLTKYGIIFVSVILILVFYKKRLFCTSICPIGVLLGLLSKCAPFKIYMNDDCVNCGMCARYCPSRCINKDEKSVNNENCVKCLKCTSVCPKGAIKYGLKINKIEFNTNRRKALISAGAFTLFAAAWAMGAKFSRDLYSKIKDIIVPAGAGSAQRMANKCLNCNLCIANCPSKILVKANSDYPAVHIDYAQGEHVCGYNCTKCSQVCPSGAIKKITLKEKQNTRIAIASVNDRCIGCSQCISQCPKGAITLVGEVVKIDGSKCIGCGACKAVCPMSAIDINAINKQTEI